MIPGQKAPSGMPQRFAEELTPREKKKKEKYMSDPKNLLHHDS
jgi:hypothetical protein